MVERQTDNLNGVGSNPISANDIRITNIDLWYIYICSVMLNVHAQGSLFKIQFSFSCVMLINQSLMLNTLQNPGPKVYGCLMLPFGEPPGCSSAMPLIS